MTWGIFCSPTILCKTINTNRGSVSSFFFFFLSSREVLAGVLSMFAFKFLPAFSFLASCLLQAFQAGFY